MHAEYATGEKEWKKKNSFPLKGRNPMVIEDFNHTNEYKIL